VIPPLLEVAGVSKTFTTGGVLGRRRVEAVKSVSFSLRREQPEIFTIIGESGSGKSTLAKMILGDERPTAGRLAFDGQDLARRRSRSEQLTFLAAVQPVFQNPFEAFNPLKRVDRYLFSTARRLLRIKGASEIEARSGAMLRQVGLSLAEIRGRFPHELSGGQLQRIAIARALIPSPSLIVADEPVSMVDASLRMSIVNLFRSLRDELKVSIIYITHDLATAYYISDRLIIMRRGEVVEGGPARRVLDAPQHPYTKQLKNAVLPARPLGLALPGPDVSEADRGRREGGFHHAIPRAQ
jgi:ABC-type oligopeptide transport system ATPase subunit